LEHQPVKLDAKQREARRTLENYQAAKQGRIRTFSPQNIYGRFLVRLEKERGRLAVAIIIFCQHAAKSAIKSLAPYFGVQIRDLQIYFRDMPLSERLRAAALLLKAVEDELAKGNLHAGPVVVQQIESLLLSAIQSSQNAHSGQEEPHIELEAFNLPVWSPETSGTTAAEHWGAHYASLSPELRPTMKQVEEADPRFFTALRRHAAYHQIELDSLLAREPGRSRGRKRKPISAEDAAKLIEERRARERQRSAARRAAKSTLG
jgi:hypothetical protein